MALPAPLPVTLCPDCHHELWLDLDGYRMTIDTGSVTMHLTAGCLPREGCGLQWSVSHTWENGVDGPQVFSCLVVALRGFGRWQVDPDGYRYLRST